MEKTITLKNKIKGLEKLVKLQESEIKELSALSERDTLTELYNRRGFIREAEKFLKEVRTLRKITEKRKISFKHFSLIFVDLDNLKLINNEYGHKTGDKALKTMSKILRDSVRDLDIVGRWGGDEFVVGLAGADEKTAYAVAENLKKKLKATKIKNKPLSASFGIVGYHKKSRPFRFPSVSYKKRQAEEKVLNQLYELIERADMSMYEAKKKKGKDSVVVYNNKGII
ncbi:MAG: GGDEF domain-containing protein [Candidatus Paceibacterota bacterium]